jgi:hypothetical protein
MRQLQVAGPVLELGDDNAMLVVRLKQVLHEMSCSTHGAGWLSPSASH